MSTARILRAFKALVAELTASTRYHVPVRYRVVQQNANKLTLQAVKKGVWPDLVPVDYSSAPGYAATLTPGSIVLVTFVEGDLTLPVVTHFAGPDEPGFVPVAISIGGGSTPAARQGDEVKVLLPPGVFTGTIGVSPATGVIVFSTGSAIGNIQTGSGKVGLG